MRNASASCQISPMLVTILLLAVFAIWPAILPVVECLQILDPLSAWLDFKYLGGLAKNTLLLVGGVCALTLPMAIAVSLLIARTNLLGRLLTRIATGLILFMPIPVLLSAWQVFFEAIGWWRIASGGAWTVGLLPSILVHSLAGFPWVVLWLTPHLERSDPGLEEQALLSASPLRVLCRVTLPGMLPSILAAAIFLALYTAGETCVVYFLQVPTLAQEVHVQFSGGNPQALARSVAMMMPALAVAFVALLVMLPTLQRSMPALDVPTRPVRRFSLGWGRGPISALVVMFFFATILFPILSLLWRVGQSGVPSSWSLHQSATRLLQESRLFGWMALRSTFEAFLASGVTVLLATWCCWLARERPWFRRGLFGLAVLVWVMPAPLLGLGLKDAIAWLAQFPILDRTFYDGPSPAPLLWAMSLHSWPLAIALVWPLIARMPNSLFESARLAGATSTGIFGRVIVPYLQSPLLAISFLLAAWCLGDVGTTGRVDTPGWEPFLKLIYDRMHYGVDGAVAALCLMQLAIVIGVIVVAGLVSVDRK